MKSSYNVTVQVRIAANGSFQGSTHSLKKGKLGTRDESWATVRGTFAGDHVTVKVSTRMYRTNGQGWMRCSTGRWVQRRAPLTYPLFSAGSYRGTTSQGLPLGRVHLAFPGAISSSGQVTRAVDGFVVPARDSCSDETTSAALPGNKPLALTLVRGTDRKWRGKLSFTAAIAGGKVDVLAYFLGRTLSGRFESTSADGCQSVGTFSGTWYAAGPDLRSRPLSFLRYVRGAARGAERRGKATRRPLARAGSRAAAAPRISFCGAPALGYVT